MSEVNAVNAVKLSNYIPEVNPEGSVDTSGFKPVSAPAFKLETSIDGGKTWVDVDASWKPEECSLDEHRQKEFAKIKQPGFGNLGKVKSDGK